MRGPAPTPWRLTPRGMTVAATLLALALLFHPWGA